MAVKPQILSIDSIQGHHNLNEETQVRLEEARSAQDLSTICIIPCLDTIPARVVQSWMNLMPPMNQKFYRFFTYNIEVGEAYSSTIDFIINHPELSKWKYVLTLEHDNTPPPDGLLKLYESMETYDAVGGIYFTKGFGGQPMCYGDPNIFPFNFIPFLPPADSVTRCNGLGMGFTLFKLDMLKDKRLPKPLFKTVQQYNGYGNSAVYTQDLKFFEEAGKLGYKFACDSRVKVGHYDLNEDYFW